MAVIIEVLAILLAVFLLIIEVRCKQDCPVDCVTCINANDCTTCVSGKYGPKCEINCIVPCSDNTCNQSTGVCNNICLADQYLDLDQVCEQCPYRCSSCTHYNNCTSCKQSYYWGSSCQYDCTGCYSSCRKLDGCYGGCTANNYMYLSYNNNKKGFECVRCQEPCRTCRNATECLTCETGYWGPHCQHNCSGCNSLCSKDEGCTGDCITGYYRNQTDSGFQCTECPATNCLMCKTSRCTECNTGYHLDPLFRAFCQACPARCSSCTRNGHCTSCKKTNYWGLRCEHDCVACYQYCNKLQGCLLGCDDKYYQTSSKWYKNSFECIRCPETCATCENATACLTCEYGYWGLYCQYSCTGCSGYCDEQTGCASECSSGHYLSQIDNIFQCEKCLDGRCLACTTDTDCKECMTGYYPANDRQCVSCPEHCKSFGYCSNRNGACTDGCIDGWSGNHCDKKCPGNCLQCEQFNSSHCDSCSFGFYGDSCDSSCSSYCKHMNWTQTCDKRHGTCRYGCENGYWGVKCTIQCSRGCFGNICNESTGVCLSGCKANFCGRRCDEEHTTTPKGFTVVVALSVVTGIAIVVAAVSTSAVIFLLKRGRSLHKETNETTGSNLSHELELENYGYEDLNRTGLTDVPYGTVQSEYENA